MQQKVIHRLDVFGEKSHDSCPFLAGVFTSSNAVPENRFRSAATGRIGRRYACVPSPRDGFVTWRDLEEACVD
jgi:hypothetical protein